VVVGIRGFEQRLERMVEGTFARVFKSGLRPVEIGRRVSKEMDNNRSVGVSGETVVPNHFWVFLSEDDHEEFQEVSSTLSRELADAAREHARDESYTFMGPVAVELEVGDSYPRGTFQISSRLREGATNAGVGSLVLPDGARIRLGDETMTIGRLSASEVVISDANVSRTHAQVKPTPYGFQLVDMGSTNGSKVNGIHVSEHVLRDGDQIEVGTSLIRFEAS
jgi:hypothetical protein